MPKIFSATFQIKKFTLEHENLLTHELLVHGL